MILAPGADEHMVLERGVSLLVPRRGSAQGDPLHDVAVVPDDRGLADHDAHAMVDEEAMPDLRARVDLDAGEHAVEVRDQSRQHRNAQPVQPVREAVDDQCVHTGVRQEHLERPARGGVTLLRGGDVFANACQPAHDWIRLYDRPRQGRFWRLS